VKIQFYAPLLISVGLALTTTTVDARTSHLAIKKYAADASKRTKAHPRKATSHRASSGRSSLSATHYKHRPTKAKHHQHIASASNIERDQDYSPAIDSAETDSSRISTTLYPLATSRLHIRQTDLQDGPRYEAVRIPPNMTSSSTHRSSYLESRATSESSGMTGAYGVIETNLADAGHKAGLSDETIEELTRIFAWDIDFASNLNPGDQFTVLYKNSPDASNAKAGRIYAAEFVSGGKFLTAIRFEDADGNVNYYTPEGNSLHKAFLSTPVDYARVSSHFDTHRRHPVLNRIRAHKGVDYAARTGTPVKAAGDGEITFKGRKGGYGQVLILKHGDRYETLYAHLSGFKRNLNDGDHVMQGEVIGYVGQTGLATGPHLHYEFRIDGVHQNPESLEFKRPLRLDSQHMAEFKDQTKPLLAKLYQTKSRNLLAKNQ